MTPLTWTRTKPREAGWYWWRYAKNAPEHVLRVNADWSVQGIAGEADHIDECGGGEFAGPITRPEEREG
jgi:hypothetical protein